MLIKLFKVINVYVMMDITWMLLIIVNYALILVLNVQLQVQIAQTVLVHLHQVDQILVYVQMDNMKKHQIHLVIAKVVHHHVINVK